MTSNDFWKHIDTIIAQGFDACGLKQLEEYAELFISGRLVYQRFPPLEQHGCAAGGSNHVIASLLARAGIEPSSLSAPEGSFQRERECAETIAWVVGLGIILDGIGQWVKVFVVNKVEKRFVKLHDRLKEVQDTTWEEVK